MPITNTSKPTQGTLTQPDRVVSHETWNSNLTTWDTETRTWDEMGSTITNTDKLFGGLTCYLKLDESSGNATDYVSGEIFADTYSNVTRSAGKINNGAVFADGTTTQLVSNNVINLDITNGYSVSFWIYPTASTALKYFIVNQPINTNFAVAIQALRLRFITYTSVGTDSVSTQVGDTPINTWTHVVCTYNTNVGTNIYINGVLNSSNVFVSRPNYTPAVISIGKVTLGSTSSYTGRLDEVGFWNTVISQDYISYLYNSTAGRQPPFDSVHSNFSNQSKNIANFTNQSKS